MKYNIQVEVDLEDLEGEIGHVYVVEKSIESVMDSLSYMGITVVSIDKVEE